MSKITTTTQITNQKPIMPLLHAFALLVFVTAAAGYINQRWFKQTHSLAMAFIGIFIAMFLFILGELQIADTTDIEKVLLDMDFSGFLLHGVLAFLLFAGAMFFDAERLKTWKWPIFSLASIGVVVSAAVTASILWVFAQLLNIPLGFWWCALFGALIAPTDPIAVMSIFREAKAPESLETKLVGESLFNDAVGIMLFLVVLNMMTKGSFDGSLLFHELVIAPLGGVATGCILGYCTVKLMSTINDHPTEMIMSLALAAGSYTVAEKLHLSAPIAVVVAGLVMGHSGRLNAMSEDSREYIDVFWQGLDELLNSMLFLLIGLMLFVLHIPKPAIILGIGAWLAVLAGRCAGVFTALAPFSRQMEGTRRALIWGGLRGGISLALALSLPQQPEKTILVAVTFFVVTISMLGQGMTIKRVIKK